MSRSETASRRRRVGALLVSLAVHWALVLLALLRVAPPAEPLPSPAIEVEVREVPVEPSSSDWVGPPAPKPAAARLRREKRTSAASASTAVQPSPTIAPAPSAVAPSSDSPPALRMRVPNLALDDAAVDRLSRAGVISAPPTASTGPTKPGQSKWQEKLALVDRDIAGRKNVAAGKVHPQIYDFMRDAEKVFAPRESVVEKDDRAPNTVGRTLGAWTRGFVRNYLDQLKKLERDEPRRKSALAEHGVDLLQEYDRIMRAAEKGAESIACQVCLIVRPDLVPEIVLAHSSGNREIDAAAVEALTRASHRRATDDDLKPQRACYRFAATIGRVPPLPMVGCGFDESKLKFGCYYPGMQYYKLKVSLDSVDYSGG